MAEPNHRRRHASPRWLMSLSSWWIVPAAVALGLLMFLAVWMQREQAPMETGTVLPAVEVAPGHGAATLPAPQDPAPGDGPADEATADGLFSLPEAPPARPAESAPPPLADQEVEPAAGAPPPAASMANQPPVAVHTPGPSYPGRSLRRRESGEVLVRAVVGADGRPTQVEVARSSSHRALDQAAVRAIRRWRFRPAMRDGEAVTGVVEIPVTFTPPGR